MIIRELTLFSGNIPSLTAFYNRLLSIPVTEKTENSTTFSIGKTKLTFVKKENATPYHFAFNIPSNKATEALAWLKERVKILTFEGKELIDFPRWNAQAIYFYDTDKNIVELIARRNLERNVEGPFSPSHLMAVSEIGIPVTDIKTIYQTLYAASPIAIYDGNFDRFCALGDENGLFIVINKDKKQWFPCGDIAFSSPFKMKMETLQGIREIKFEKEIFRFLK